MESLLPISDLGVAKSVSQCLKYIHYQMIDDPKKLEEKRRIYMTPEEIEAWLAYR